MIIENGVFYFTIVYNKNEALFESKLRSAYTTVSVVVDTEASSGSCIEVDAYVYVSEDTVDTVDWTILIDSIPSIDDEVCVAIIWNERPRKHWILIIQVNKKLANKRTNKYIEIPNLKVDSDNPKYRINIKQQKPTPSSISIPLSYYSSSELWEDLENKKTALTCYNKTLVIYLL